MKNKKNTVCVYALHTGFLETDKVFLERLSYVTQDRYEKIQVCKVKEEKKRLLAAGLLLEEVLKERGYQPQMIAREEGGKPYLCGVRDCYFNISHSGEYVVCAVASEPVGIDIQEKKKIGEKVADRFFLKEEADHIKSFSGKERQALFFRYWTGKESYVKLTGRGIKGGLKHFRVDLEKGRIIDPGACQEIYLKEYPGIEGYCICVSSYSNNFAEKIESKFLS